MSAHESQHSLGLLVRFWVNVIMVMVGIKFFDFDESILWNIEFMFRLF